jgi:hypothetical protein
VNENNPREEEQQNDENRIQAQQRSSKPHLTTWIEAFCAVALVLITGTYTFYAARQANVGKKAAEAAKTAADTARETLVRSQRPWVGVDEIRVLPTDVSGEVKIKLGFFVRNYGPSPALHEYLGWTPLLGSKYGADEQHRELVTMGDEACRGIGALISGATAVRTEGKGVGYSIFPNSRIYDDLGGEWGLSGRDINLPLHIVGCIGYLDQWHTVHHTMFCYETPGRAIDFMRNHTLLPCMTNDEAD